MHSNQKYLNNYRVPKKKNKEPLELLSPESEHRNIFISKIRDTFKKPKISKDAMKFHKIWLINVPEVESIFSKKRLSMKNMSINLAEAYAFLYLKSEFDLKKIVQAGKLKIGNLKESCIANPSMGVSLSQHADIYHPDYLKSGILLLVKYIKGRINYVLYDCNPMDPQPNFDCHVIRKPPSNDSNISLHKAFYSTQVFIYEYTEDIDIQEYPSQMLIVGAAQFSWHGSCLYKHVITKDSNPAKTVVKRINSSVVEGPAQKKSSIIPLNTSIIQTIPTKLTNPPLNVSNSSPNALIQVQIFDEKELMSAELLIGSPLKQFGNSVHVKLISRLKESLMIFNLMSQPWYMPELVPYTIFENYMRYKSIPTNTELIYTLSSSKINTLPQRFNDGKSTNNFFNSRYAIHLTIVPNNLEDRLIFSKIITNLQKTQTVGSVRCNALYNIFFYIIPPGKLSKSLGISQYDAPDLLHVVLLTQHHPEFIPCNYSLMNKASKKELKIFDTVLKAYETPSIKTPLVPISILKNSIVLSNKQQKQYYDKLLKPTSVIADPQNRDSDMEIDSNDGDIESNIDKDKSINNKLSRTNGLINSQTYSSSQKNGILIPVVINETCSHVSEQVLVETQSDSKIQKPSIGTFTLVVVPEHKLSKAQRSCRSLKYKLDHHIAPRRSTPLDSAIFEPMANYPHVSIYKG